MTKIEWTDESWNPIVGCTIVSPGCTNCYAMRMADRVAATGTAPYYAGLTQRVKGKPVWTGAVGYAPDKTWLAPLRWRKPRMIFVNSMGDLFHEDVPDEMIDRAFAIMALTPWHTYQVLTKRDERMQAYARSLRDETMPDRVTIAACDIGYTVRGYAGNAGLVQRPLPNVWLGVSVEDQQRADERIPVLMKTPAAVRFVSAEPLLGIIDFSCFTCHGCTGCGAPLANCEMLWMKSKKCCPDCLHQNLDLVIVGGESGPGARPMHPDWPRSIRDQCQAAGVAFFFKQWGEWFSVSEVEGPGEHYSFADGATVRRTGKRLAGRTLDGREWNEMPGV